MVQAHPEQEGAKTQQKDTLRSYSAHAYDEIQADRLKQAEKILQSKNQALAGENHMSVKELSVAAAIEKSLLTGDTATLQKIDADFQPDPAELQKIVNFVEQAIKASVGDGSWQLFAGRNQTGAPTEIEVHGDKWKGEYSTQILEISPISVNGWDGLAGEERCRISVPTVKRRIAKDLVRDIIDNNH